MKTVRAVENSFIKSSQIYRTSLTTVVLSFFTECTFIVLEAETFRRTGDERGLSHTFLRRTVDNFCFQAEHRLGHPGPSVDVGRPMARNPSYVGISKEIHQLNRDNCIFRSHGGRCQPIFQRHGRQTFCRTGSDDSWYVHALTLAPHGQYSRGTTDDRHRQLGGSAE